MFFSGAWVITMLCSWQVSPACPLWALPVREGPELAQSPEWELIWEPVGGGLLA